MKKSNHETKSSHSHESCKELFSKLSDYIDGELHEVDIKTIKHHLEGCKCCEACFATLKQTIAIFSHEGDKPVPERFKLQLSQLAEKLSSVEQSML